MRAPTALLRFPSREADIVVTKNQDPQKHGGAITKGSPWQLPPDPKQTSSRSGMRGGSDTTPVHAVCLPDSTKILSWRRTRRRRQPCDDDVNDPRQRQQEATPPSTTKHRHRDIHPGPATPCRRERAGQNPRSPARSFGASRPDADPPPRVRRNTAQQVAAKAGATPTRPPRHHSANTEGGAQIPLPKLRDTLLNERPTPSGGGTGTKERRKDIRRPSWHHRHHHHLPKRAQSSNHTNQHPKRPPPSSNHTNPPRHFPENPPPPPPPKAWPPGPAGSDTQ